MASQELFKLNSAQGLLGGIFPSVEKTVGPVWREGSNVLFRDLAIEQGIGNRRFRSGITRAPRAIAQAYADGQSRLYYENNGQIYNWNGEAVQFIGAMEADAEYELEPFGSWLIASDNVNPLKVWKNTATFETVGEANFLKAKILKKFQNYAMVYCTDELPNGYHWSDLDKPHVWEVAEDTRAGAQPIIEFESEIMAVAQLGQSHAVYSKDSMALVNYVGGTNVFGYRMALSDIGAVSKRSVIELGRKNFGLNRAGVFVTDGVQFEYIDRPAVNIWLRDNVDWSQAERIYGYSDERLGLLIWNLPIVGGGQQRLAFNPQMKSFTRLSGEYSAALPKQVFDYPILTSEDGLYYASDETEDAPATSLISNPLDGGAPTNFKSWDYLLLQGTFGGLSVRIGYSDTENGTVTWSPWKAASREVFFKPRESVYLTLEFASVEAADKWRLTGITAMGEVGGFTV